MTFLQKQNYGDRKQISRLGLEIKQGRTGKFWGVIELFFILTVVEFP